MLLVYDLSELGRAVCELVELRARVPHMTDYPAAELLAGRTRKAGRESLTVIITRRAEWVPAHRQLPKPEWSCAATSAAGEILPRAAQAQSRPQPLLAVSTTAATASAM